MKNIFTAPPSGCLFIPSPVLRLARVLTLHYRLVLIILAAALVVAAVVLWNQRKGSESDQRLAQLVKGKRRELYSFSVYHLIRSKLNDLYNPSFVSVATVLSLALVSGIFAWWRQIPLSQEEAQLLIRLQALEVGIALVFVPITVFVIGLSSRKTEGGVTAAEVLLKQTYLFPIAIFVLALLANFAFLKKPIYGRFLILLTLSLAVFCIFRLCRVLLDEHYLHASSIGLLQDKIRRTIDLAVTQRLGRNIMLAWIEHKKLEYSPFISSWRSDEDVKLNHERPGGTVKDIHLGRLSKFIEQLERYANDNGFSFEAVEATPSLSDDAVNEVPVRPLIEVKHRYIAKLLGDSVGKDSATLGFFDRRLEPDATNQHRLAKLLSNAFLLAPGDSYEERVERYLANVKDEVILAIRDHRTAYLENLLEVYEKLAETFLQEIKKIMGGYSLEAARQERQNIVGGWNELRWISDQLKEIQNRGVLSGDQHVAHLVSRTPIRIAYSALRYRDHLLFEEFSRFPLFVYSIIPKITDSELKSIINTRIRAHLRELGEYGIALELDRDGQEPQELSSVGTLATILFVRYHELLIVSVEKNQLEDFDHLLTEVNQLLERQRRVSIQEASWALAAPSNSQNVETRLKLIRETRVAVSKQIADEREKLLFSLNSILLLKIVEAKKDGLATRLSKIDGLLTSSIVDVTSLYLRMPGAFTFMSIDGILDTEGAFSRINQYYCYLLLKLSQQVPDQQFATLVPSTDAEFILRIESGGPIRAILSSFETNRELWRPLVPDEWLNKIPLLQGVFDRLVWAKKLQDEDRLINMPLDVQYLSEFRVRFRRTFEQTASVRDLFRHFNAYQDGSGGPLLLKGVSKWGLNTLDSKGAYVIGERQAYVNWPEEYAKNLATSEGEFAFHQLLNQLPEYEAAQNDLRGVLEAIAAEFEKLNVAPQCVMAGLQSGFHLKAEQLGFLVPSWVSELKTSKFKEISGFRGILNFANLKIPVFSVWTRDDGNWACAVSFAAGINWNQQPPIDDDSELETKEGFLSIRIQDLSANLELRQKIVASDPAWLKNQPEKERYLSKHVVLQAVERFQISASAVAGVKFKVPSAPGLP